jgi:hypothetical protein
MPYRPATLRTYRRVILARCSSGLYAGHAENGDLAKSVAELSLTSNA